MKRVSTILMMLIAMVIAIPNSSAQEMTKEQKGLTKAVKIYFEY